MYLQTSSTLTPNDVIKNLFEYLYSEFTEDEISHFFKLNPVKCQLGRKKGALDFASFARVKEKCGFSYANLYHKGIDHDCIKTRLTEGQITIPKRYSRGAFSSRRTSHNILLNTSNNIVQDAKDFLQIDQDEIYSDDVISKKISTLMNSDLLEYLAECHLYTDDDIYQLGQKSGHYNLKLPFGNSFKGLTPKQSFSRVIEEIIRHFETSFEYRLISLTDSKAVIRKHLTEKMKEECKSNLYSNRYLSKYIQGSFSAITLYTTGKFAHTTQEKCVFNGDGYSEFHIHLKELSGL